MSEIGKSCHQLTVMQMETSAAAEGKITRVKQDIQTQFANIQQNLEDMANLVEMLNDEQALLNTHAEINASPVSESA